MHFDQDIACFKSGQGRNLVPQAVWAPVFVCA